MTPAPETEPGCPFCNPPEMEVVARNKLAYARMDRFPIARGHMLVIPFRHYQSFFESTADERSAITELIILAKGHIEERHHPDGYNIGTNVGRYAGQAIMHLHFHVIPRYRGDSKGHHGGMRWVIPRGPPPPEKSWFG
ncbi:MAG TPA: HIT family protein [Methanomicrobiales archaeon]|nr:HIT family protein [Methanomicrobiales archaeon]